MRMDFNECGFGFDRQSGFRNDMEEYGTRWAVAESFGGGENRSVYCGPTSPATDRKFVILDCFIHFINSFYATAFSVLRCDPEFVPKFVGRCENL